MNGIWESPADPNNCQLDDELCRARGRLSPFLWCSDPWRSCWPHLLYQLSTVLDGIAAYTCQSGSHLKYRCWESAYEVSVTAAEKVLMNWVSEGDNVTAFLGKLTSSTKYHCSRFSMIRYSMIKSGLLSVRHASTTVTTIVQQNTPIFINSHYSVQSAVAPLQIALATERIISRLWSRLFFIFPALVLLLWKEFHPSKKVVRASKKPRKRWKKEKTGPKQVNYNEK